MFLKGKTVLVTGAGGSIGSALCRELLKHEPGRIIALDNSELALYNLERALPDVTTLLDDIASGSRSRAWDYLPDVVFHAAAYKHVTLCERNVEAAWRVNVYGTKMLVEAARAYKTPTFVLISTDKAVNPTCVMGRSKQRAEEITRQAGYSVIRLGNVWGSSGSAVPLWKQQITEGRPVTITDERATRYFMYDHEAAYRIIQAAELAKGGEVFVPFMGAAHKITDIARQLGAKEFNVIGLRPGEKLHEELFAGDRVPVGSGMYVDQAA